MIVLPPSPRCERCKHTLCPFCMEPWCDTILEESDALYDDELCCNGMCTVDLDDFRAWLTDCFGEPYSKPEIGVQYTIAEGPFHARRS